MSRQTKRVLILFVIGGLAVLVSRPLMTYVMYLQERSGANSVEFTPADEVVGYGEGGGVMGPPSE
jgi:hypothetical protein